MSGRRTAAGSWSAATKSWAGRGRRPPAPLPPCGAATARRTGLSKRSGPSLPLLLRVTRPDDHLVRRLVVARPRALGRLAPGGDRVAAARRPAFAAAVRVVDRILGDTAGQRALAHPARASGLGEVLVLVVRVGHRAHRRHAIAVDVALLARVQP